MKQLQEVAGAKFVWPFQISMAEERRTLYYLIYVTNHFKGLMLMKTIMYNEGRARANETAWANPQRSLYG